MYNTKKVVSFLNYVFGKKIKPLVSLLCVTVNLYFDMELFLLYSSSNLM